MVIQQECQQAACHGGGENTQLGKPFHTTPSTAKNAATGMVTLVDRPSNPSVMFTAFTVPTMIKAARIM